MKTLCAFLAILLVPGIAAAQALLPVTFQWDASATPSTTENPIKYRVCYSLQAPANWPAGSLPTDRVCADAGTLLEWRLSMPTGTRYVFCTARNYGVTSDGVINPGYEQESGASNVLRIEIFAPPGNPKNIRIKSVSAAMQTISGQTMSMREGD